MPFGFAGRDASILLPSLPPSPWANAGLKRRVYITLQTHYCSLRSAIGHQNKTDSTLKSVNRFLGNCLEFLPSPCPKQLFIWCSGTELIWERIRNSTLLTVVTGVSQCDSWLSPSRISLTNSIAPVNRVKVNTGSSSLGPGCVPPSWSPPGGPSPLPPLVPPSWKHHPRGWWRNGPAAHTGFEGRNAVHPADIKLGLSYFSAFSVFLFVLTERSPEKSSCILNPQPRLML